MEDAQTSTIKLESAMSGQNIAEWNLHSFQPHPVNVYIRSSSNRTLTL